MNELRLASPALLALCALATACFEPDAGDPAVAEHPGSTSGEAAAPDTEPGTTSMSTTGDDEPEGTTGSEPWWPEIDETSGGEVEPDATGGIEEPCDTECRDKAPLGWSGPYAFYEMDGQVESPPCDDGDFTDLQMVGYHDVLASPASCECECSATGVSCDGSVRVYRRGVQASEGVSCLPTIAGPYSPNEGIALDIPNVSSTPFTAWNANYTVEPHIEGGSCQRTASESVAPASFGNTIYACAAPLDATGCNEGEWCEGEASDEPRMCIWQPGDVACPAHETEYRFRQVIYQGIQDDRECTECSCGEPVGYCEDPSVRLMSTNILHQVELNEASSCDVVYGSELGNYDISGIMFDAGDPVANCQTTGGIPVGSAVPTNAVTVCCAS